MSNRPPEVTPGVMTPAQELALKYRVWRTKGPDGKAIFVKNITIPRLLELLRYGIRVEEGEGIPSSERNPFFDSIIERFLRIKKSGLGG